MPAPASIISCETYEYSKTIIRPEKYGNRLGAIDHIAHTFHRQSRGDYWAGPWGNNLAPGMLWRTLLPLPKSSEYVAPI